LPGTPGALVVVYLLLCVGSLRSFSSASNRVQLATSG
jgi:hypothetical protein